MAVNSTYVDRSNLSLELKEKYAIKNIIKHCKTKLL
jgi:hypothetical protein